MVPLFKMFVTIKHMRAAAFDCLGAIVSKGMDANIKLQVVSQLGFLDIISTVEMTHSANFNPDDD